MIPVRILAVRYLANAAPPLCRALEGVAYREDAVSPVLDSQPMAEMFGGITKDEVLRTIFNEA